MNDNLIIIGAGSLGVMTLDAALEMNEYNQIYFIDDGKETGEFIHDVEVLGGLSILDELDISSYDFVIAIANNKVRGKIANGYKLNYVNIIHPKTSISRFSKIKGKGNIILSHTSIDPNVTIFNHVIINKNNSIGHDSVLKNSSQVSPGCSFGGFTVLEKGVFFGIGASTIPNVTIGLNSIIGAGAVVTQDIPANVTAVGVPAKIIKE